MDTEITTKTVNVFKFWSTHLKHYHFSIRITSHCVCVCAVCILMCHSLPLLFVPSTDGICVRCGAVARTTVVTRLTWSLFMALPMEDRQAVTAQQAKHRTLSGPRGGVRKGLMGEVMSVLRLRGGAGLAGQGTCGSRESSWQGRQ